MEEFIPCIRTREELLEKARTLPLTSGVYLFYDKNGKLLYVGKSKALKNRVLSYFRNQGKHNVKTEKLVSAVADFQTIVTSGEREALILENEKIKLHRPKYNIRLKDDKDYPYLCLTVGEDYPRLKFVRRRFEASTKEKALYFGPYASSQDVRHMIDTANKLFLLPTCKKRFPQDVGKSRPCLYYQLGRCVGVCTGQVSKEDFRQRIERVILFLKHDHKKIAEIFRKEMDEAAERLDFETAAQKRDRLRALERLNEKKQVIRDLNLHADVFGVYQDEIGGAIQLLTVRENAVQGGSVFHFGPDEIIDGESFQSLLIDLYRLQDFMPKEILLPSELWPEQTEQLSQLLAEGKEGSLHLSCPERGQKRELVRMAEENARSAAMHRRALLEKDEEVLIRLSSLLCLDTLPDRVESIDVSNSAATSITAGIITLVRGRFSKKDYKTFRLTRTEPDDPWCMYEAYSRRIKRYLDGDESFCPLPDLILCDGATAQVNAVRRALAEQGVSIPVFGMVKDAFHKTRCLTDGEREISIAHDAVLFQWIYSVQEEVHRYSFRQMDTARRKSVKRSVLTELDGIGEKKATALLRHFKSLKRLRSATEAEIAQVRGISRRDAKTVFDGMKKEKSI